MLTHIDENNRPKMVDITLKEDTSRRAIARSLIKLPSLFNEFIKDGEILLKKGPVIQTAIIAGTMAVKKTSELIPFCHNILIDSCKFDIHIDDDLMMFIDCEVKTTSKTGVEMEALTGATVAALSVYDMTKALSHEIVIQETKLLVKTGGKNIVLDRPLYGLILTGGKSERMLEDKALLNYHGKAQALHLFDLIKPFCDKVFLSAKDSQWDQSEISKLPTIVDDSELNTKGPLLGMLSAFNKYPKANWLVLACDLVHVNTHTIENLLMHYKPRACAIAYKNREKDFLEPLCTIYTPSSFPYFYKAMEENISCPVKILKQMQAIKLNQNDTINLANINTPSERNGVLNG